MNALENEGVKWFTETDISVADDEELLWRMKGADCTQILIGLESNFRKLAVRTYNQENTERRRCFQNWLSERRRFAS